jgi:ABC-type multidrug transport system ATPase subunit
MTIYLSQIGKRYRDHWIFKEINYTFEAGEKYALLGPNGSGKSTLLRIISGMQSPNKGTVRYQAGDQVISSEKSFSLISYCAPGMELIEEMTLYEFLKFHFTFKKSLAGIGPEAMIRDMQLEHASSKFIHEFSSGMKQRVKLAQAFFTATPLLLLDEPCSNLDTEGVAMYRRWMERYGAQRTVLIASNDPREYEAAKQTLELEQYKSAAI